ncbi:MAG: BON domain-containing protein [Actinobacteria bacterium]|nr:BON domain-containing protein [Actinomycetota bacterium]
MTDEQLRSNVTEELFWDPRIDSGAVAVSARNGMITLRGTVGSFQEKRDAANDALRLYGVTGVTNELQVRLLDDAQREDADLRGAVLQALTLDSLVPPTVNAAVTDGWVTLTGTTSWQYQRDEAESRAGNIAGVVAVTNDIELAPPAPAAAGIRQSISDAMQRNARIDADSITVDTGNSTVTLHGTVSSWADHDDAITAAWAAPGVTNVIDDLHITY